MNQESGEGGGPGGVWPRSAVIVPGDGIGPEVVEAARRVLAGAAAPVQWDPRELPGPHAPEAELDAATTDLIGRIQRDGIALKGPLTTPVGRALPSLNVALRRRLGLFVQLRECRSFPGVPTPFHDVDLVVMRETTEDLYAGIEYPAQDEVGEALIMLMARSGAAPPSGAALSIKYTSAPAARRMLLFARNWSRAHGRRRVTVVHKATVMRATDGLFLSTARDVFAGVSDLELDDCLVDTLCADLVRRPQDFDVLVMPNQYGDIVSDLAAGLVGGVGLVPGANHGDGIAVFEPAHGSAPRHAGHGDANPTAAILCGVMLLRHIGAVEVAARVEQAVRDVIAEGREVTYDMRSDRSGGVPTAVFADAVIARLS